MHGSIVKRGNKYSIVYDLGKDENGKRRQKWEGSFTSRRQAEKALRMRIDEIENSFVQKQDDTDICNYLRFWLQAYCEPRLARNTVIGYRNNIEKHIIPCIGSIRLYQLKPLDIEKMYRDLRKKNLSETSLLYVHRVLRNALNYAVKHSIITKNAADHVDAPRKNRFEAIVLRENEIVKLLNACNNTELRMPILLAVTLGLRRGEILGLKWDDINFDNNTVEIRRTASFYKQEFCLSDTKTPKSRRTLLFSNAIKEELIQLKMEQEKLASVFGKGFNEHGLVICRADGQPLSSATLNHQYKKVLQTAGLPDMRFHDLRHTNATLMLHKNVPAKIVSSILGHSSIGITLDLYSHAMTEMQQQAVNVIDELLKPK